MKDFFSAYLRRKFSNILTNLKIAEFYFSATFDAITQVL